MRKQVQRYTNANDWWRKSKADPQVDKKKKKVGEGEGTCLGMMTPGITC